MTIPSDTQLLNWLIASSAYVSHSRDGEVCNVWFRYDPNDDSGKCYYDAREAIAAAMIKRKF